MYAVYEMTVVTGTDARSYPKLYAMVTKLLDQQEVDDNDKAGIRGKRPSWAMTLAHPGKGNR